MYKKFQHLVLQVTFNFLPSKTLEEYSSRTSSPLAITRFHVNPPCHRAHLVSFTPILLACSSAPQAGHASVDAVVPRRQQPGASLLPWGPSLAGLEGSPLKAQAGHNRLSLRKALETRGRRLRAGGFPVPHELYPLAREFACALGKAGGPCLPGRPVLKAL